MTHRMNLTLEKLLKALNKNYHESNTQYWSKSEAPYELTESNETFSPFKTNTGCARTMKQTMTINSTKEETTDFKFDTVFFHTRFGFSPHTKEC